MSQSQMHDDSNANKTETNKVDPNWRDDALNLELDYGMQTIAVRAGQHRTDEGEHVYVRRDARTGDVLRG